MVAHAAGTVKRTNMLCPVLPLTHGQSIAFLSTVVDGVEIHYLACKHGCSSADIANAMHRDFVQLRRRQSSRQDAAGKRGAL